MSCRITGMQLRSGWKFGNVFDEPLSMARPIEKKEATATVGWGLGVTGLCKSYSGDNLDEEQTKAWKC